MPIKPVVPRERARRDLEEAVDYLAAEASEDVALNLLDDVEIAYRAIADSPAAGSPRYAHELNLPGLRSWHVKRHSYLIFYVEREDHIDVWRVLHAGRDLPAQLQTDEGECV